jgi:hypothetical protein
LVWRPRQEFHLARRLHRGPQRTRRLRRLQALQEPRRRESWRPAMQPQAPRRAPPLKCLLQRPLRWWQRPRRPRCVPFFGNRSGFGSSRRGRGGLFGSLGTLDLSCRFRCAVRVPFFGSRRRRVVGSTSLVAGSAGDFALFPCSSFGTSGGDKWNTRHSDPVPLRHEPGQGRSAAKSNSEAIVNMLLQPRPYLQNNEGNMSK